MSNNIIYPLIYTLVYRNKAWDVSQSEYPTVYSFIKTRRLQWQDALDSVLAGIFSCRYETEKITECYILQSKLNNKGMNSSLPSFYIHYSDKFQAVHTIIINCSLKFLKRIQSAGAQTRVLSDKFSGKEVKKEKISSVGAGLKALEGHTVFLNDKKSILIAAK